MMEGSSRRREGTETGKDTGSTREDRWSLKRRQRMRCYQCSIVNGSLPLLENEAAAWLDRGHLRSVNWLPADEAILDEIEKLL